MLKRSLLVAGLAFTVLAACGRVDVVGSRFVKSADVSETKETLIEVQATEELSLAGTQLQIPAGAVSSPVRVTLELGFTSITSEAIGPVAVWEPSGLRFSKKATMRLPVDLPDTASTSDVYIEVLEGTGERLQLKPTSVKDGYVTFEVDGFTSFQPALKRADGGVDGGGLDGGPFDDGGLDAGGFDASVGDGGIRPDAGSFDGGGFDGGAGDGGIRPDAGSFDGGGFDGGAGDGGIRPDAGSFDGGGFDGGAGDGGIKPDAGSFDGGFDAGLDGGSFDAGAFDAGIDAGAIDAGSFDAGLDAGSFDAGLDGGSFDAGLDAGSSDAGRADAGTDAG